MNVPHVSPGTYDLREPGRQALPLTRRALTASALAGGVALACGATWQVFRSPVLGDAAAAPKDNAGEISRAARAAATPGAANQVTIANFAFSPDVLSIPIGTEVTWTNQDDIPHTVTSDDKTTFASSLLDTGDRFSFTFAEAGTFSYFCSVHPMMTAKVAVQG